MRLWADDGIARTFDDLTFTQLAYTKWQNDHFAGGSSNANAAPNADPDHDGNTNEIEFGTGTDPNVPNPVPGQLSIVTVGSDRFLRLTVPKNELATDTTITVEAGSDLSGPNWSGAGLIIEQNTPTLLQVRDNVPLGSTPSRFLRVKVGMP